MPVFGYADDALLLPGLILLAVRLFLSVGRKHVRNLIVPDKPRFDGTE
ncbi:hypothetical protein [Cupriavidus sp. USMAA2-4]